MRLLPPCLSSLLVLLAAGCGGGDSDATRAQRTESVKPVATMPQDEPTRSGHGTVGQVSYDFDDRHLTRTEIQLPVPPRYTDEVWAVKLIPNERAEMLGQKICHYGQSQAPQMCNAVDEAGLALAMLERPIADYRAHFTQNGFSEDQLETTKIGGRTGFAVSTEFRHSPTEYRFVPVAGRTLMLARQAGPGLGRASKALGAVMSGLHVTK